MNNFVTISKYGKNPRGNKSNNNSSSISLDNYVNNLKTFTRKEPDKVLNIPEIREKLFAGVNTINVSTQNLANPPIQEDGFASEQNILELFVTEIDEKILIPE